MLNALEHKIVSGLMRQRIAEMLSAEPKNLDLHKALLRLATLKDGTSLRLVTTNFDRCFEHAAGDDLRLGDNLHTAPTLPVPYNDKEYRWKSLVHLHGRINGTNDPNHHLILTSADFGRAYLTDGWAARFVTRLFDEFSVVFIGYSLNDPVLRYMTDALGAEAGSTRRRMARPRSYIFAPYNAKNPQDKEEWSQRGLQPIFYHSGWKHRDLNKTIIAWSKARDDWLQSKKSVLAKIGAASPKSASPDEKLNFMWAIGVGQIQDDPAGAKQLAAQKIPIAWLREIEKHEAELINDRITENKELSDRGLPHQPAQQFPVHSLLIRPDVEVNPVSETTKALGIWLMENLDNRDLIHWAARKLSGGKYFHPAIVHMIRRKLEDFEWQNLIYKKFWNIVCVGEQYRPSLFDRDIAFYFIRQLEKAHDMDIVDIKTVFLSVLRPVFHVKPPWDFGGQLQSKTEKEKLQSLANIEIHLAADNDLLGLINEKLGNWSAVDEFLADYSDTLTSQLHHTLDLWALAGNADKTSDIGAVHRSSIVPHEQNSTFHSWTWLIEWIWRGWQHIDEKSESRSRRLIAQWRDIPYPTFYRLALAATANSRHVDAAEKLGVLLGMYGQESAQTPTLWFPDCHKEVFDLMVAVWPGLSECERTRLLKIIAAGPPADMFVDNDPKRSDRMIYNILKRLEEIHGGPLPQSGADKLKELQNKYLECLPFEGERAHFSTWFESHHGPDSDICYVDLVGMKSNQLLDVLKNCQSECTGLFNSWLRLSASNPFRAIATLYLLHQKNEEIPDHIFVATLNGMDKNDLLRRAIARRLFKILNQKTSFLTSDTRLLYAACRVLDTVAHATRLPVDEQVFWDLWGKTFPQSLQMPEDEVELGAEEQMDWAINHPVGILAEAAMTLLFQGKFEHNQRFPKETTDLLNHMIDDGKVRARAARIRIALRANFLCAVDPGWMRDHFAQFFDWNRDETEASALWDAFAWGRRISFAFWTLMKEPFLACFTQDRLSKLSSAGRGNICELLTLIALDLPVNDIPKKKIRDAIKAMPPDGRVAVAKTLAVRVQRHDKPDHIWTESVKPFLENFWPKEQRFVEEESAGELVTVAIATDQEFEEAVNYIRPFLVPSQHTDRAMRLLDETSHPDCHPSASLVLLAYLFHTEWSVYIRNAHNILTRIAEADPSLCRKENYRKIDDCLKRSDLLTHNS